MSEGWSKLRDIDLLADSGARFDVVVPLDRMVRVPPEYSQPGNAVRGIIGFGRDGNRPVATVAVSGSLELICQRCMAPMQWPVATDSSAVLLGSEREADELPQGTETVLAPDRKVRLIDLIEEELLLALPLVPLHEAAKTGAGPQDAAAEQVQRPFEQLGELFKRHQ